jgi:UDP-N-acetylglucosamine 1-carboxyvinyltransferase
MDKLKIIGGTPLHGVVNISGAKNAALPELAACLLTGGRVVLHNVPAVKDVQTFRKLLSELGVHVTSNPVPSAIHNPQSAVYPESTWVISAENITSCEAPYDLVKTMRASVLCMGPLLARFGSARVSLPGGCAIGARPINLHLKGFEKLGAEISVEHGYVEARCQRLTGAEIYFDTVTVTGTENLMMAATLAEGETLLLNAACEPEIPDLAKLLVNMGADIEGAGTRTIKIRGVRQLGAAEHSVIPDRIETGTFMVAAAIARGTIEIRRCQPAHLLAIIEKLRETGTDIQIVDADTLRMTGPDRIQSVDVTTNPYPAFATDMQAQYMALMTQGDGKSVITETIFENRFMHAFELMRMGAFITTDGNRAIVRGPRPLTGAQVIASDLRASASLVLAGLVAKGETIVDRVYHLDRGYEGIEAKFRALGAQIERIR